MSRTDHHRKNARRENNAQLIHGAIVKANPRNRLIAPARAEIAEQLADMLNLDIPVVLPPRTRPYTPKYDGLQTDFVTRPYTIASMGWREVRLSDCEFGCKEFERTYNGERQIQVQHNRTYGCRKQDEPIIHMGLITPRVPFVASKPVIQRHTPKRRPVTDASWEKPNRHANLDVETPSLMQMAKARAKALGL